MRFLFTTFEGGGHVPPALLAASALRQRGHEVLLVSDPVNEDAARAVGLAFAPWRTAPQRTAVAQADDPLQDWRRRWPPRVVKAVCDAVMTGPAEAYANDTRTYIDAFSPDLVVSNELLLGAMIATESSSRPLALLSGNLWPYPTRPDLPPFGPGWPLPRTSHAVRFHQEARQMIQRWFDAGLGDLNRARVAHGLAPLSGVVDQLAAAALVVLGTSRTFDYGLMPPSPFIHAGPLIDLPEATTARPATSRPRPRVLVSFSTTFQNQAPVMARCLRALAPLDVDVIATTGPALDPGTLPAPGNAKVVAWADHDVVVPECDLVICHGGHGTLLRPLRHGVPVLCLPMGRDHPENGRRLAFHAAGVVTSRDTSTRRLRALAKGMLANPAYAAAAGALGRRIVHEQAEERAAGLAALERLAAMSVEAQAFLRDQGGLQHPLKTAS
ncbi:glycosyltransferase [Brevundimonas sp. S30B]|uniref:glycosyltransferase n=1 Tax=unclassified Brevundimonas TaxID=2622653 RepID=UPI001071C9F1|nr:MULTISPECIES: glycosyltransferase [unclassified Brevundimonas]QBX38302.1 glycosyltransferase [Brevundimonas sp. MF30-B]TFW01561.1 glycosyltransferase [Brevundimonas sp. S30B]